MADAEVRADVAPGQRVRDLRLVRGWSMAELARRTQTTKQTIDKIERGETLRSRILPQIASELGVSVADIDPRFGDEPPRQVSSRGVVRRSRVPSEGDVPIYGCAEANEGSVVITFQAIDYLRRPTPLAHVADAYALLLDGTSMVPALEPGDIVLVNPLLFPRRGMSALFLAPENEKARAMPRRYEGQNDRAWKVSQWNPSRHMNLEKKEWPRVHTVVGKYSWR